MLLIMAQVDDAPGELIEDVVERLQPAGARNVHILASLAKKDRPGHVLLIDVPEEREEEVALLLGAELGCGAIAFSNPSIAISTSSSSALL